jgi:predicted DNA-binding transcriptional regulator
MSIFKRGILSIVMAGLIMGMVACEKKEGPMEKAGKKVDEAIEKTEETVKEKTE